MLGRTLTKPGQPRQVDKPESRPCEEKRRLQVEFLRAVHELNVLQTQQMRAVVEEDPDFPRFDVLIYMAQEKKDAAKYLLIAHIETHKCEEDNDATNASGEGTDCR
jgi:hypothetical protein